MSAITTPFGFSSTADDVVSGIDLTGRRAVVTGASSGIGAETARALAATGAAVTLAVRDVAAGERVAKDITVSTGNQDVRAVHLDLTDPTSVTAFTAAWQGPLHVLVHNAGVMACPEQYTEQGWEWQFATNHLGHFALATGLHGALAADGNARVVVVSSTGHQRSPVVWDDVNFGFRPYDPWLAYGQSKTANVLFAVEATRRWADDNITANALMPGAIHTNLQRHTGGRGSGRVPAELIKTVGQGAATSALLATSPLLEGVGGRYFVDCNETGIVDRRSGTLHGVARYAVDPDNARRLWALSEELLDQAA
ncbi:NAD(P)-dependent dehydrogenase (short-subunit alcohol dehydrogenase family) [Streptomyces sp. SAI-135]|uniref:SDR family NAD(P)-dependent oxidoreductase n=1 Tax=unclassified Streptomyces TaxID=2593676 RepID=UPI002476C612|nr:MULTISPECIES: SDR family NAD(P)-dependent oxidoreductase [unclassified Streptomyces]MDH6521483.1 NAD(P)-dependent dehydrogenase (short-subunit alcohol dehydrogenase family) [Streptomyces sp. SAI-090]MDH6614419.1 NAD(P)-dependent dehydrogenase (short-subunit alcohol dehydrogenase family) [Streptomyces sp. SAI-135]